MSSSVNGRGGSLTMYLKHYNYPISEFLLTSDQKKDLPQDSGGTFAAVCILYLDGNKFHLPFQTLAASS